jgi:hypothetical protein
MGSLLLATSMPSMTIVWQEATSLGMGRGVLSEPSVTRTRQVRHLPPEPLSDE